MDLTRVRGALVCAIVLVSSSSCNSLTGTGTYEEVRRCTGPRCGACPSGEAWDPEREACIDESTWCAINAKLWDPDQQACLPVGSCPAGQRWYDDARLCLSECPVGTSECAYSCCGHKEYCVAEPGGARRCSKCEMATMECGPVCCKEDQVCVNAALGVCSADYGSRGRSCAGGLTCGANEDCCATIDLPGGTFRQGSAGSQALENEKPERDVTVSPFSLEKFEVTVGRMRRFAKEWDRKPIPEGAGANPRVPGSGWRSAWNWYLPAEDIDWYMSFVCDAEYSTWESTDDGYPITCVQWQLAFAFCVWDGGRLPTEAEWEYAATGGEEGREYPWGSQPPDSTLAVYYLDSLILERVGTRPLGAGRWGHLDLAGNLQEWVLDTYDPYPAGPSTDYCSLTGDERVLRGGDFSSDPQLLRASRRHKSSALGGRGNTDGFRCAHER